MDEIVVKIVQGLVGIVFLLPVVAILWAVSRNPMPRVISEDSRFVVDRRGGVRRRHADPWDVRCTPGRVPLDNLVNVPTWTCVVEGAALVSREALVMVGPRTAIAPEELPPEQRHGSGRVRGRHPAGTTALGEGWPPVSVFGVADERAAQILARDDVREALAPLLQAPDFVLLQFEANGRFTVQLRRAGLPTAEEVEDGMKRVEAVANVIVPACRAAPGGPRFYSPGTVGANGAPVSTGLPLR